jgi:LDH2 family malate/lactate/ureidoglycolate dehydrogenase
MSRMLAEVKAVKKQPGVDNIRLPSENSYATRRRLLKEGIEIDLKIHKALLAIPKGSLPEQV